MRVLVQPLSDALEGTGPCSSGHKPSVLFWIWNPCRVVGCTLQGGGVPAALNMCQPLANLSHWESTKFELTTLKKVTSYTLNRTSFTCFVRTKPRGSFVITNPLAS